MTVYLFVSFWFCQCLCIGADPARATFIPTMISGFLVMDPLAELYLYPPNAPGNLSYLRKIIARSNLVCYFAVLVFQKTFFSVPNIFQSLRSLLLLQGSCIFALRQQTLKMYLLHEVTWSQLLMCLFQALNISPDNGKDSF